MLNISAVTKLLTPVISQCFIEQFGRMYLYSAIITEKHITLYQLDRCGVIFSDRVDIHRDPHRFIRWIIGMSSTNESKIGFDPTIRCHKTWTYIKILTGPQKRRVECIIKQILTQPRNKLCGRETVCLLVHNERIGFRVVKQYWRSATREPEENFFKAAEGLLGVAQMVAYDVLYKVSEFRCTTQPSEFKDRELVRITFEHYGNTIENSKSKKELLAAFLDAVAGEFEF